MNQRFFGHPESQLFGVFHAARRSAQSNKARSAKRAVLICPPVGQEYIRSHWCLRLLANQLTRKGVNVLRMDYAGIGDSAGSIEEVQSLDTWQHNIETAIAHLKTESGAETVCVLGLRMGAALASRVAENNPDVNSVVLWEPVVDGDEYVNGLRDVHRQMIDLWVCRMETPDNENTEEMLGSRYSRSLMNEIEGLRLNVENIVQPQLIIELASVAREFTHPVDGVQRVIKVDDDNGWTDLSVLETAWLRPVTTRTLVKTVDEMFGRLEKFDALTRTNIPVVQMPTTASLQSGVS